VYAVRHVVGVSNPEPELSPFHQHMEDKPAQTLSKFKNAISRRAQLTVLLLLGANGVFVTRLAEVDLNLSPG